MRRKGATDEKRHEATDEGACRSEGDLGPGRDGGGVVRVISSGTQALDAFTPGAIVLDTRHRGGDAVRVALGGDIDGQQLAVGGGKAPLRITTAGQRWAGSWSVAVWHAPGGSAS